MGIDERFDGRYVELYLCIWKVVYFLMKLCLR